MPGDREISDEQLSAYIDGAIDPAQRLDIALHLARHPDRAARTEALRAQNEAIHALFDHVLAQPVPGRLRRVVLRRRARASLRRRLAWALGVAGIAMIVALGGQLLADEFSLAFSHFLMAPALERPSLPPPSTPPAQGRARGIPT